MDEKTFPNSGSASEVSPLEQPLEGKKTTTIITAKPALNHLSKIQETMNQAQNGLMQRQANPPLPLVHHSTPIINAMSSIGLPADFTARANLAMKFGMQDYYGSSQENMRLLQMMQSQQPQKNA